VTVGYDASIREFDKVTLVLFVLRMIRFFPFLRN